MKRDLPFLVVLGMSLFFAGCGSSSSSNAGNNSPGTTASQPGGGGSSPGTSGGGTSSGPGSGGSTSGGSGSGTTGGATTGSGASTSALAYVGGSNQNFYGLRVDSSSAVNQVAGSPYSVPGNAGSMALSNNLLYVSVGLPSTTQVSAYRADANGALTKLADTKTTGAFIAYDPSGKFLYVDGFTSDGRSAIFGYSVDPNSGNLTALANSPWASVGESSGSLVVSSNGSWICTNTNLARTNDAAECYARRADGTVDTSNSFDPLVSDTDLWGLAITSDNLYVVGTDGDRNEVLIAPIASHHASNTPVRMQSGGKFTNGVAVSGKWIAVANRDSQNVSILSANPAGQVTVVGAPVSTGGSPVNAAFSASGSNLFVTTDKGLVVFSFHSDTGALTPVNVANPAPGAAGELAAQ